MKTKVNIPPNFKQQRKIKLALRDYRDPMFDLAEELGVKISVGVEIGSQFGWWAYRFLTQVPNAKLYCVDTWADPSRVELESNRFMHVRGDNNFREWSLNLKQWIAERRVVALRGKSSDVAKWFNEQIDFLFIDGDHSEDGVFEDLCNWVPKLSNGGLVVGHDWDSKRHGRNVRHAVNRFWAKEEFKVDRLYYSGSVLGECFYHQKGGETLNEEKHDA